MRRSSGRVLTQCVKQPSRDRHLRIHETFSVASHRIEGTKFSSRGSQFVATPRRRNSKKRNAHHMKASKISSRLLRRLTRVLATSCIGCHRRFPRSSLNIQEPKRPVSPISNSIFCRFILYSIHLARRRSGRSDSSRPLFTCPTPKPSKIRLCRFIYPIQPRRLSNPIEFLPRTISF